MRIRFFALAALALSLAACTQDEAGFLPEGAEGTSIIFTATGARVPAVAVAAGFSPVAVKTMGVPSAPSGRKPASSCVQAARPSSRAMAADIWMVVRFMMRVV